jgi:hypothetical protein
MTPEQIRDIVDAHELYWASLADETRRLTLAYRSTPLESCDDAVQSNWGYEFVEGAVASLFSRAPSVVVSPPLRPSGKAEHAQALVNPWLEDQHDVFTDLCRVAQTYRGAWIKLAPCKSDDPYQRIATQVVHPWDVIVDRQARTFNAQRYRMHRYWLPIDAAVEAYGQRDRWQPTSVDGQQIPGERSTNSLQMPSDDPHVEIVEVYDYVDDSYRVWSRHYMDGLAWVQDGIELEVGGQPGVEAKATRFRDIPFRHADGRPVRNLIPLAMSAEPGRPTSVLAPLARVLDPIREHSVIRTWQSRAVRKASRVTLIEKGWFDEENYTILQAGADGSYALYDGQPGRSIAEAVRPMPWMQVPQETYGYLDVIREDFQRGSNVAPFTRGEATNATATEVTALAAYSATEIARMARQRDAMIVEVARAYIAMIRVYIGKGDVDVIRLRGELVPLRPSDLDADFGIVALDQGSTPLGDAARKAELMSLVPLAGQLGIAPDRLLAEIVRRFDLPPDWAEPAPAAEPTPASKANQVEVAPDTELLPGAVPMPTRINEVLPEGGF